VHSGGGNSIMIMLAAIGSISPSTITTSTTTTTTTSSSSIFSCSSITTILTSTPTFTTTSTTTLHPLSQFLPMYLRWSVAFAAVVVYGGGRHVWRLIRSGIGEGARTTSPHSHSHLLPL